LRQQLLDLHRAVEQRQPYKENLKKHLLLAAALEAWLQLRQQMQHPQQITRRQPSLAFLHCSARALRNFLRLGA
jgi:hypothetical protein